MIRTKSQAVVRSATLLAALISLFIVLAAAQDTSGIAKRIGTIKAINGSAITLSSSSGPDTIINVQASARLLRMAPGDKDLKNASPIQLADLKVGDTIRARGQASTDGQSIAALEIIVITSGAIDAVRDQIRQDWQKRGMGGLVKSVDPAANTVTISVTGLSGTKTIAVHCTAKTVLRRYAPDSVKFDDAKPSTLTEIKPGDQLRARGDRSADGLEVTAEEIVTGSFQNIAGTVNSVDPSAGTLNVQDLLSKKPAVIKVTPDSQLHKIPAEMATMIAARLKHTNGGAGGANGSSAPAGAPDGGRPSPPAGGPPGGAAPSAGPAGAAPNGNGAGGARRNGDFQQMLSRMPTVTLADLKKGDAVLIVATQGSTAITLLSGVEPILQAAPGASQAAMLTPWSLGGAPGGEGMQ